MTLFNNLPLDIQRLICFFLVHKDIKKLNPRFYDNEDDVYWKEKLATVTDERTPEGITHRDFYESFLYEKIIEKVNWNFGLLDIIVNDEVFLNRHIDTQDKYGETALMYASYSQKKEIVKKLIDFGANVNHKDKQGCTALLDASGRSNTEIIEILINAGADVNHQNKYGTILMAALKGHNNSSEEIAKILLAAGADATINAQNISGFTALMYAVEYSEEIVKTLLAAGANVNLQDVNGNTALMYAALNNKKDNIKILLDAGAIVNHQNRCGATALSWTGNVEIKRFLLSKD
jgi:ankyrin repeat protein